jgi:hypothetical protein
VVTDHVDNWDVCSPGVVEISQTVAKTGAEVEQGDGRLSSNTGVAIGSPGHDTLEESEYTAHPRLRVESGDKVHLAGPGIAKTEFDAIGVQRGKK